MDNLAGNSGTLRAGLGKFAEKSPERAGQCGPCGKALKIRANVANRGEIPGIVSMKSGKTGAKVGARGGYSRIAAIRRP